MFGVRVSICIIPYLSESIQPWPLHVWHFNDIQQLDARLDESLRFSQCASQTLEVTSLLVGQTRWHLTDLTDVFSCVFFLVCYFFKTFLWHKRDDRDVSTPKCLAFSTCSRFFFWRLAFPKMFHVSNSAKSDASYET